MTDEKAVTEALQQAQRAHLSRRTPESLADLKKAQRD